MKCPVCGAADLVHDTRDIPYTYKGRSTVIPNVTGEYCPACDDVVLDAEQGDRYSELIRLFKLRVDMKCPTCGKGTFVPDTRDVSYTYKGETTTFPNVTAEFCTACDEHLTAMGETQRVMDMMAAFHKQVDATGDDATK